MEQFSYNETAEVYASRGRGVAKRPVIYKRFDTGSEAVRYVMEGLSPDMRGGAVIEAGDGRFTAADIRQLYDSPDYPLARTVCKS